MYYRDIIITAAQEDRLHFLDILMTHVHEQYSRLKCAVVFPDWVPASPNAIDSFDTFTRYAEIGDVVRLFADEQSSLQEIERIPGVAAMLRARVLLATSIKPVPPATRGVAFCRVRSADSLGRRVRNASNPEHRDRLKDEARAKSHERAFFRVGDKDGLNVRPMVFTKVSGVGVSPKVACNSFGLSSGTEPCFLPEF